MRIVLTSAGPRSEVFPMFALAGELKKRGHTVTLCVPEKYRSKSMVLEYRMVTCGAAMEEYFEGPRCGDARGFVRALAAQVPAQFVAMRDSLREADALVSGGLMLAGASQAELQHIPYFSVIQTPLLLDPEHFPCAGMPLKRSLFDTRRSRRREWDEVLLSVINREREMSHMTPTSNLYHYLYRTGHVFAAVDPAVTPLPPGGSETVTGLWYFDDGSPSTEELSSFLNAGTAPVLIEPLGLPEGKAVPFLEQLCAQLSSEGIRAVVNPAWTGIQQARLPEHCRILSAFPTNRFAALLHSGTSQAFAAAACAGIPQVTVPVLVEHGYWSERISELGVGQGGAAVPDPARTAAALREAVAHATWRDRSRDLGAGIMARNGASAAADVLERELPGMVHAV